MGLSTVTPPALEPLSLDEAKAHSEMTSSDRDGLISGYILSAREFVENSTHLKLITQTLDYTIDEGWPYVCSRGYEQFRIEFPVKPVASVTSITYVDTSGASQTLASNQYVLRNDGPVHFVEPVYGVTWPAVRCQTAAVTVRFVAGGDLSSVPNPLMQVMRLLVAHQIEKREPIGTDNLAEVALTVEAFLSPYRFIRFSY